MPKELSIVLHPNPILREISKEIDLEKINKEEFQSFLLDLKETMLKKDGAGLAAPQVAKNIRVVAIHDKQKTLFMINPTITKKSWAKEIAEEGCLSVLDEKGDNIYGKVERSKKINCIYFNEKGKKIKIKANKLLARVIQHEIDHLDGVLFIDKVIE